MRFDCNTYYGNIVKGELHAAMDYVKQFPEKAGLSSRFIDRFERGHFISYDIDPMLNEILMAYQSYYRNVFYFRTDRDWAEHHLKQQLSDLLQIEDAHIALCDMEETLLVKLFEQHGFHFLGGKTSGYFGPYVWRTTEAVSYDVELPDGIQKYTIHLLDHFLTRSWMDYLSFGEIGPGGWTDNDGSIHCVKSAWDLESEHFRVSLLKHEAQHAKDLQSNHSMSSEILEYRAKLVELIYSCERNLLPSFIQEADHSDNQNGHAMAADRLVRNFTQFLETENWQPATIPIEQIQTIAKTLFAASSNLTM